MGLYIGKEKFANNEVITIPIKNQDKTITSNGIYTADEGYSGLGQITVDIPSQGYSLPTYTCEIMYDKEFDIVDDDYYEMNFKFTPTDIKLEEGYKFLTIYSQDTNITIQYASGAGQYKFGTMYIISESDLHNGDLVEFNIKGHNRSVEFIVKINGNDYRHAVDEYYRPWGPFIALQLGGYDNTERAIFDLPNCYIKKNNEYIIKCAE